MPRFELRVLQQFDDYSTGDHITHPAEVDRVLAENPDKVVKIAPADPAEEA